MSQPDKRQVVARSYLDKLMFPLALCSLSLTKWIHLHAGDSGILKFFSHLSIVVSPGGQLLLEPQAFASYHSAVRDCKKNGLDLSSSLEKLVIRPEDFQPLLNGLGLEGPIRIADTRGNGEFSDLLPFTICF